MGLIDRAFGADKNSMLFNRLALHWRMVASHYENYLTSNPIEGDQKEVISEIHSRSVNLADKTIRSIKGFGVTSPDVSSFLIDLDALAALQKRIQVTTEKSHWLPEAVYVTKDVLSGNKKRYMNNQFWFSD